MGFLMPDHCGACGRAGWRLCPDCVADLRPSAPASRPPPGLDSCSSLVAYEGSARRLVGGLKFGNRRGALGPLGGALAARAGPQLLGSAVIVTWPPASTARRRRRGYDQAELLAKAVGRAAGLPVRGILRRHGADWTQTGRGRSARLDGPSFRVAPPARLRLHGSGARWCRDAVVVIVDDVVTTGATLAAAAAALRSAGAAEVHALTVAVTVTTP
jgi:predicted amidophosphoribosyltransferase